MFSDFDTDTERCIDCDGHFRHFPGCSLYEGEPVLDLAQRVALATELKSVMG